MSKFLIVSHFSNVEYSGGRFVAYNLILSLASNTNNDITVWTNTIPVYQKDYKEIKFSNQIKYILSLDYLPYIKGNYDFVILIPENTNYSIFEKSILTAAINNSKLILYNFETPNWFNEFSKIKRNENLWNGWQKVSDFTSLIISISNESLKYAKKYYKTNINFAYWYPPINTFTADLVQTVEKKNQIVIITRFSQSHKGSGDLFNLFKDEFNGYAFNFIVGSGGVPQSIKQKLQFLSDKYNIKLNIYSGIDEYNKFKIISESKAMVFISEFEGLGIPPLEALYMNTRCLSFYLPVLQETIGEIVDFCTKEDLIEKLDSILTNFKIDNGKTFINSKFSFAVCSKKINELFTQEIKINSSLNNINKISFIFQIIYKDLNFLFQRIIMKISKCLS